MERAEERKETPCVGHVEHRMILQPVCIDISHVIPDQGARLFPAKIPLFLPSLMIG
jgi:hypothetical protein